MSDIAPWHFYGTAQTKVGVKFANFGWRLSSWGWRLSILPTDGLYMVDLKLGPVEVLAYV